MSAQEAQCAAKRVASAGRKPSPPKCKGKCAHMAVRVPSLANNALRQARTASSWRWAKSVVEEGGKARSR